MQSVCISAAAKKLVEAPMNFVFGLVRRWIDRFMVAYWVKQLAGGKRPPDFAVKTSGTVAVDAFVAAEQLGSTVFWAVPGAGKSFAVAQRDVFMVVNWHKMHGTSASEWFEKLVGCNGSIGGSMRDGFSTIVFDHFDNALAINRVSAMQLFLRLTMDSVETKTFNVLVCVNDASNALELLRTSSVHVHLLGPSYCGRCGVEDLTQMALTPLAVELAVLSGAIGTVNEAMSTKRRHNDWLSLRAARLSDMWKRGEAVLWSYRVCDV